MKRSGFTMIELIFVIVILGILAAVAIPRLAATRDDATISTMASDVATAVSDFGARYTAQGTWAGTLGDTTNVVFAEPATTAMAANTTFNLNDPNGNNCVDFVINGQLNEGNLSVVAGDNNGTVCAGVRAAVADVINRSPHLFGGSQVNRN